MSRSTLLIRTDLTLAGETPLTIEGLKLVFAFKPEASIFYHAEERWVEHLYERSPAESGTTVAYPWYPLVWVGNHDIGFMVVTETRHGWTSADKGAITFTRDRESFTLTLNLITSPTRLNGKLTYGFAMMATPAKPMREDRFGIQIGSMPGMNLTTTMHGKNVHKHFSYPQATDFNEVAEMLAAYRQRGVRHCYYIICSASTSASIARRRRSDQSTRPQIRAGSRST